MNRNYLDWKWFIIICTLLLCLYPLQSCFPYIEFLDSSFYFYIFLYVPLSSNVNAFNNTYLIIFYILQVYCSSSLLVHSWFMWHWVLSKSNMGILIAAENTILLAIHQRIKPFTICSIESTIWLQEFYILYAFCLLMNSVGIWIYSILLWVALYSWFLLKQDDIGYLQLVQSILVWISGGHL